MTTSPITPGAVARFSAILLQMTQFAGAQTGWGLSNQMIALIVTKLQAIKFGFERLAARIAAGTDMPRQPPRPRHPPPDPPTERKPRTKPLVQYRYGWLRKLLPETVFSRLYLERLFESAEMQALMAAAPEAMRRPLRTLCHMLDLPPPAVLALPPRPPRPP